MLHLVRKLELRRGNDVTLDPGFMCPVAILVLSLKLAMYAVPVSGLDPIVSTFCFRDLD